MSIAPSPRETEPQLGANNLEAYFMPFTANRRFKADPYNMDALREALTKDEPCPCAKKWNDQEILAQVAWQLTEGTLRVAEKRYDVLPRGAARGRPTQPTARAEAPPAPVTETPPPEPAPEPTDEENVDAAAQAATLKQAAQDGTPFCEECEKARQEREAQAAAA